MSGEEVVTYDMQIAERASEVATLRASLTPARAEVSDLRNGVVSRQHEMLERMSIDLSAARAECEALRMDAERYRWLRTQPNDTTAPRIDVVHWLPEDEAANAGEGLRMDALDTAIDQARKTLEAK